MAVPLEVTGHTPDVCLLLVLAVTSSTIAAKWQTDIFTLFTPFLVSLVLYDNRQQFN